MREEGGWKEGVRLEGEWRREGGRRGVVSTHSKILEHVRSVEPLGYVVALHVSNTNIILILCYNIEYAIT